MNKPLTNNGRILHLDHIVDLTHTLTSDFPYIPVKGLTYPFELISMATLSKNGVAANSWKIHEHLGTHTDAPNHFVDNQKSLDQIDLKDLIVPVVVIDIKERASHNRDAELTVDDIRNFEKQYGKIPDRACVMMYSGWEEHLKDSLFVGLDRNQVKHFPGFSDPAIKYLLANRNIAGIGVDVLSFDPGIDGDYTGHKTLFAAGKWAVECVANLSKIPKTGATIIVGAPKIGLATGGFSRIIAVW
ncbi:cyclase family protein [Dyadobacter arcticus]|uniref:Kynurenine formamidase n=1 Tax=Dyadobacter arcticus TaxID=1078754 RepID=A0ABX0UI86_9BACT|nr:cyclase family protein [Dyadobacter arcticus]NIJ52632.1 kynurenine formamidase [Dyadobacter arcticus]